MYRRTSRPSDGCPILEALESRLLLTAAVDFAYLYRVADHAWPGIEDDSLAYSAWVAGPELGRLQLTTPWGETFDTDPILPPDWDGSAFTYDADGVWFWAEYDFDYGQVSFYVEWYDLTQTEWARLSTGKTTVLATDWWSDTWQYSTGMPVVQPPQPTLTFPVNGEAGVPSNPTIGWRAWSPAPTGLDDYIGLTITGPGLGDGAGAELVPTATSWSLPPAEQLLPDSVYDVDLEFWAFKSWWAGATAIAAVAGATSVATFTTSPPGLTAVDVRRTLDCYLPGPDDDQYVYDVALAGYGLSELVVETPWGESFYSIDHLPANWNETSFTYQQGPLTFTAYTWGAARYYDVQWRGISADDWASLDAETAWIMVADAGGRWEGTVDFAQVTQPTQVPTPTQPADGEIEVVPAPTIQWTAWASPPPGGEIELDLTDLDSGQSIYADQLLPPDADQWTVPAGLDPATAYQLDLTFRDRAYVDVNGLTVSISAESIGAAEFTTAAAGVWGAWLDRMVDYGLPGPADDAFQYNLTVGGVALTGVGLLTPWDELFDTADYLPPDWAGEGFLYEVEGFFLEAWQVDGVQWFQVEWSALTPEQWGALDAVSTLFAVTYDGGSWSGEVDFWPVIQPVQEPTLIYPAYGQADVPPQPTLQWLEYDPRTANAQIELGLYQATGGEQVYGVDLPGDVRTWQVPDMLDADTTYMVELDFEDRATVTVEGVDVHLGAEARGTSWFTTLPAGATAVRLSREIDYEIPYRSDDALGYEVEIEGCCLTGAGLVTPWFELADSSEFLPDDWDGSEYVRLARGALEFEAWAEDGLTHFQFQWGWLSDLQWASLDAEPTIIAVSYGQDRLWSAVLDFAGVTQPTQEPRPSSPTQRKIEPSNLTVQWPAWADPPTSGAIALALHLDDWVEETLPALATSWTPPSIPPAEGTRELEISFVDQSAQTVDGVPVITTACTQNDVRFLVGDWTDDHGNTPDEATPIAAPGQAAGELSYTGDIDFFAFQVSAGVTYDILVDLPAGGLEDSSAWLYDTGGRTLLTSDDDGGHVYGSRILWTAPVDDTYCLAVDSWELGQEGDYTVQIAISDLVPDDPSATFEHPVEHLWVRGGLGAGVSQTAYTGATSAWGDRLVLHLLGLGDPLSPTELGACFVGDWEGLAQGPTDAYVYVADGSNAADGWGFSEVVVLEFAGPGELLEVNRVGLAGPDVHGMTGDSAWLYVYTVSRDGPKTWLEVYSLDDVTSPRLIGATNVFAPGTYVEPEGIIVADGRVYVLDEDSGLVAIVDVSDPTAPAVLGEFQIAGAELPGIGPMAMAAGTLWLSAGWELWSYDVTDPTDVRQLGAVPLTGQAGQIEIEGDLAFVGCTAVGGCVVDIGDPENPQVLRTYVVPGATGSIAIDNGRAYIPTHNGYIAILPATIEGDADVDGDVDFFDFLTAKAGFGTETGAGWADGDFDGDGDVDFFDFLTAKANFGQALGGESEVLADEQNTPASTEAGRLNAENAEGAENFAGRSELADSVQDARTSASTTGVLAVFTSVTSATSAVDYPAACVVSGAPAEQFHPAQVQSWTPESASMGVPGGREPAALSTDCLDVLRLARLLPAVL